jgi:hypothetical protein
MQSRFVESHEPAFVVWRASALTTSRFDVNVAGTVMKPQLRVAALLFLFVPAAGAVVGACSGDDSTPAVAADAGLDSTVVVGGDAGEDAGFDAATPVEASCAVFDAGAFDDAQVQEGKQIVIAHLCTSCHGEALTGTPNGVPSPTAIGGTAYPPNLTSDPATGLGCWTNDQIVNAILHGIDNEGMALCAPMPVFGSIPGNGGLDAGEAADVVAFLRSLAPVSMNIPDTPACPAPEAGPPEEAGTDAGDASTPDADAASMPDADAASDAPSDAPDGD